MVNHPNRTKKPPVDTLIRAVIGAKVSADWHAPLPSEPPCGPDEWRQRNRREVIQIASMETSHLIHCFRFANTRNQHRSKLDALQAELKKRQGGVGRLVDLQPAPSKHSWARGNSICLVCGAPKSEDAPPFCEVSDC